MSEQAVVDRETSTDDGDDSVAASSTEDVAATSSEQAPTAQARRRLGALGSRRGVIVGLVSLVVALAIATGVLAVLLVSERGDAAEVRSAAQDRAKAEQVALGYAVGAARLDYQDLPGWHKSLVAGTSPELNEKLTTAATSMEQVVVPLQWMSTAQPIAAQVTAHDGDRYTVVAFVNVTTRNAQSKDGVQSTATYTIDLDQSKDWLITDVGGFNPIAPK